MNKYKIVEVLYCFFLYFILLEKQRGREKEKTFHPNVSGAGTGSSWCQEPRTEYRSAWVSGACAHQPSALPRCPLTEKKDRKWSSQVLNLTFWRGIWVSSNSNSTAAPHTYAQKHFWGKNCKNKSKKITEWSIGQWLNHRIIRTKTHINKNRRKYWCYCK